MRTGPVLFWTGPNGLDWPGVISGGGEDWASPPEGWASPQEDWPSPRSQDFLIFVISLGEHKEKSAGGGIFFEILVISLRERQRKIHQRRGFCDFLALP